VKFLFRLHDKEAVETVLIPENNPEDEDNMRYTLCVSSQVGCAMNCGFCATGKIKYKRNLSSGEIVDQFLQAEKISGKKITNIVFMGMGEPLQNMRSVIKAIDMLTNPLIPLVSERRITISTSGIVPRMIELADMGRNFKLALSLHSTTNDLRKKLMPIAEKWSIDQTIDAMENYYRKTGVPLTYEYIMFDGLNDTQFDAKRLAKIARRAPSRVNLIPYHDISFTNPEGFAAELKPATQENIMNFIALLRNFEVNAFLRTSSGFDIDAACGQLALSERNVE
jgi:23S rRNA (adenine2503-C2)-methyltransferase